MILTKIKNFFNNSIYILFYLLFLWTLSILLFIDKSIEYFHKTEVQLSNLSLLMAAIIAISLYLFKLGRIQFKEKFNIKKTLMFLSATLLILQLFLALNISFKTGWDVAIIDLNSNILAANLDKPFSMTYFQWYPNNVFMLFIFTAMKRLGMFLSLPGYGILIFIGILITNISVLLTSLIAYKVTNNKNLTIVTFVIATLFFGLSPWIVIPYSDVYSLVFPILTLFVYINLKGSKCPSSLRGLLILLIPLIGYLIKPQNIIVLIAIIITEVINMKKNQITIKNVALLLLIMGVSLGSMRTLRAVSISYTGVVPNHDLQFPMHHWAMMGLNERTNGVFAREDRRFTSGLVGKELKKEQNIIEIKRRLSEMGLPGYREFLTKKTLTNYNDGTFNWGREGNHFAEILPERVPVFSSLLRNIYYNDGDLYLYFATFQQMMWMMVLALCLIAGILRSNLVDKKEELIILLSLMGVTLFPLIFEARARYLFLYVPIYILCAMIGLYKLKCKMRGGLS